MKTRILRFPIAAACLGLTTGLLPSHLSAMQSATTVSTRSVLIRTGIPASDGELDSAVLARITRGDELTGMRRFAAAESEYRGAAEIVRRHGHLPSFTLWRLASAYYYQGDPQRAAAVLEQLAAEAGRCGDLAVEALALFNAAWLNGEGGRGQTAATEVADLTVLLRSPYMPDVVREHLTARLAPTGAVAVTR
jgi:hypothetical protein